MIILIGSLAIKEQQCFSIHTPDLSDGHALWPLGTLVTMKGMSCVLWFWRSIPRFFPPQMPYPLCSHQQEAFLPGSAHRPFAKTITQKLKDVQRPLLCAGMHPKHHRWLQLLPEYAGGREPSPAHRKGSHLALLVFISSSKVTQLLNSALVLPSALSPPHI